MAKIAVQVEVRATEAWTRDEFYEVAGKLDQAVVIEQEDPRNIIVVFQFEGGPSLSVATQEYFKEQVRGVKGLEDVRFRDGGSVVQKEHGGS